MDKDDRTNKLEQFNDFLSQIDLGKYRSKYAKIKLVELDLPINIQAIKFLYECYWDNFNLFDYRAHRKTSTGWGFGGKGHDQL